MRWVPRLPPSLNSNYPSEILYFRLPVCETLTILLALTFSMMFSSPSFADWKKVSENVEGDLPPNSSTTSYESPGTMDEGRSGAKPGGHGSFVSGAGGR